MGAASGGPRAAFAAAPAVGGAGAFDPFAMSAPAPAPAFNPFAAGGLAGAGALKPPAQQPPQKAGGLDALALF